MVHHCGVASVLMSVQVDQRLRCALTGSDRILPYSSYLQLMEWGRMGLALHVMTEMHFTSKKPTKYHAWSCQNVCDALTFQLDNIFIRFGTKLYRQVVEIPMGT